MPGGNSKWEPPDPISNSEVKLLSADDSVGFPHVKVGHCQALKQEKAPLVGAFSCLKFAMQPRLYLLIRSTSYIPLHI